MDRLHSYKNTEELCSFSMHRMTTHRFICLLFATLFTAIQSQKFDWLLYSFRNQYRTFDNDCLLYNSRYYCHEGNRHDRQRLSCPKIHLWSFANLKQKQVTTNNLLEWNVSFQQIERYAIYLWQNSSLLNGDETFHSLCNCTFSRIGQACEYQLPSKNITLADEVKNQIHYPKQRRKEIPACLVDGIVCRMGLLCLEWRQVCDGIIHCSNGADEDQCHLLELNYQCNNDEFQCRHGLCIPSEFLFDGISDCMDASDEQETQAIQMIYNGCDRKSARECDEHLCRRDEFSCGDGECIHWSNILHHQKMCDNLRDAAFHCELVAPKSRLVTSETGVCVDVKLPALTHISTCVRALRRVFLGESRKQALLLLNNSCPELIQYPEEPIFSSVLTMYHNKTRIMSYYNFHIQDFHQAIPTALPDLVCLKGSMLCNGTWVSLLEDYCVAYLQYQALASYRIFPLNHWFCQIATAQHLGPFNE